MFKIDQLNDDFEASKPHHIISWAVATFGSQVAVSSSFQMQSLPLLHIVSQVAPQLPVMFLDTGYHFPETLMFRDQLVQLWGLNLKVVRTDISRQDYVQRYGNDLYQHNPDLCCYIHKVEPMQRAVSGLKAWISGIRRDQSPTRAQAQIVEKSPQDIIRIHPMTTWTRQDIWHYINKYALPDHPLLAKGYLSIGCAPCTRPIYHGEDERNGRWEGHDKTECGLHTKLRANGTATAKLRDEHKQ